MNGQCSCKLFSKKKSLLTMSINRCFRGKQFFSFHNSKFLCSFSTKMNLHSKQRKNDLEFKNLVLTAQSDFSLGSKKADNHHLVVMTGKHRNIRYSLLLLLKQSNDLGKLFVKLEKQQHNYNIIPPPLLTSSPSFTLRVHILLMSDCQNSV